MNRVHEQCPKIDSRTVLSQTGSKQAECTKCTTCWPTSTPMPRALPRLHATPARPSACPASACRARPARPPAASAPRARLPCAPRKPACRASPAVSWAWLGIVSQYNPALPCSHVTIQFVCIAIQTALFSAIQLLPACNTNQCIVIQNIPAQPSLAIHLNLLQYNSIQPTTLSIVIQCNPCNTIFP